MHESSGTALQQPYPVAEEAEPIIVGIDFGLTYTGM
jgi:hypothetical protein